MYLRDFPSIDTVNDGFDLGVCEGTGVDEVNDVLLRYAKLVMARAFIDDINVFWVCNC